MAVYNKNTKSWTPFNYAVNQKTDYSGADFLPSYPDKTAADFASNYPSKTAADFASTYPANRATNLPTTQKFFVKFKPNGKVDEVRIQDNDPGTNWKSYTLRDGKQIGDYGFSFPDGDNDSRKAALLNARNQLDANNTTNVNNTAANNTDLTNRNNAATQYNTVTKPQLQNTAATNYNATQATSRNTAAAQLNTTNQTTKTKNTALNNFSSSVISAASTTQGGDYLNKIKGLDDRVLREAGLNSSEISSIFKGAKDSFDAFYLNEKISPWDPAKFGAQPPAGGFDAGYYASTGTGKQALQKWKEASSSAVVNGIAFPDLDITARYNQDSFLHKYYTDVGKTSGDRGNAAISANLPQAYSEKLTDADYQLYRDQVLGLSSDQYPSTVLEGSLSTVLDAKDKQKQQMFGALTQDSLKASIDELKKAKKQENNLSLFRGLPGYDEIYNLNNTLSNSLLGDSGVGGLLSITKNTDDLQKSLEKQLSGVTGINTSNSAVYNWQQWFDTVLTKRYEEGLTVADPADAKVQYEIDKEFATKFIGDYLKPRFDTSRSMDEFVSYMDVTQKEENIFQTQSALDSLRTLADVRAKAYLDGVQGKAALNFNPDFYFNPTENEQRATDYAKQASEVAVDWEAAKKGDAFWAAEAYRYGLDVKDKAQFAKLHYEVKGAKQGYDAARDVITLKDAQEYIDKTILPAVSEKEIALGDTAFLQFVTPEEFADKLIEGISPEANKEEWKKLLDQFGIDDTGQSVAELRDYIIEALRTGAAKDIRESIKYLNEKKVAPSQEELGITYIQREEDKKPTSSPSETQLYKIFKDAGYQGTEDEFYTNFFPDADRSEQVALTKAGTGAGFQTGGVDMSDPFAALSSLGSFFDSGTKTTSSTGSSTSTSSTKSPSYFNLFEDSSTDEASQKTKSGQQILGEFTSLFKGFT